MLEHTLNLMVIFTCPWYSYISELIKYLLPVGYWQS